jgi:hypothetical protein
MPLAQIVDTVHLVGGNVEVRGLLPRDLDEQGQEVPFDHQVVIGWAIFQGDVVVQGTLLAKGAWPDKRAAGDLKPGKAAAAAVAVTLRGSPESGDLSFETFTWSQEITIE